MLIWMLIYISNISILCPLYVTDIYLYVMYRHSLGSTTADGFAASVGGSAPSAVDVEELGVDPAAPSASADVEGGGSDMVGGSMPLEQRCSMRRAARYLHNALYLVRSGQLGTGTGYGSTSLSAGSIATSKENSGGKQDSAGGDPGFPSDSEGGGMTWLRTDALEEAVLLHLCYVHLSLGDPVCALGHAEKLMSKPGAVVGDRKRYDATYSRRTIS